MNKQNAKTIPCDNIDIDRENFPSIKSKMILTNQAHLCINKCKDFFLCYKLATEEDFRTIISFLCVELSKANKKIDDLNTSISISSSTIDTLQIDKENLRKALDIEKAFSNPPEKKSTFASKLRQFQERFKTALFD